MLYIREQIPSKLIQAVCCKLDKEHLLVKINQKINKLLLFCNYSPQKALVKDYLECISKELDSLLTNYDNNLMLGDFTKPTEP